MTARIHEETAPPPAVVGHALLSDCCCAMVLADVAEGWGICSECKQHARFSNEEDS